MHVAYADPPYIGQAKKHYDMPEVDHEGLILELDEYDGWALSASSPSLPIILPMCPDDIRIGAWVKPFASFKKNVNPAYAWEPVIFKPCRKRTKDEETVRDWVAVNITMQRGLSGAKPEAFCFWMFQILGMRADDEFVDLYPGTEAVTEAWHKWRTRLL